MSSEKSASAAGVDLTDRERRAYEAWRISGEDQISATLNAKMFGLFLQGKSCEEIERINSPRVRLGHIVAARIAGEWDTRRQEHLDYLMREITERLAQATMETIDFVCDILAVANREHGDRLRRYLLTGDEKDLGTFRVTNMSQLRIAVDVLQKLGGGAALAAQASAQQPGAMAVPVTPATPAEAGAALKLLKGLGKKE